MVKRFPVTDVTYHRTFVRIFATYRSIFRRCSGIFKEFFTVVEIGLHQFLSF